MKTISDFTNEMVAALRAKDPSASAEIGTPERKIIEAVATVLARAQVDFSVLQEQHNIDLMTAGRLDSFLGTIFKFGRQSATASTGVVRFQRLTSAVQPVVIPRNTQLRASVEGQGDYPDIPFVTTEMGVIAVGESYVDVAVQSAILGTMANVPAGSITSLSGLRTINGINSITNSEPTSGAVDAENDESYRTRFKNQFFRNISGTIDQYLALAVSATGVSKANVIGPISRYVENIQIPTIVDGVNEVQTASVPDAVTDWTLTVNDEYNNALATTGALGNDTTADAVETALNAALNTALSTAGVLYVDVTMTGTDPRLYTVTFIGPLGRRNLSPMTKTETGGIVTIATVTGGTSPTGVDDIQTTAYGSYDYGTLHIPDALPLTWRFKATTEPSSIPYSKHTYPDGHYLTDSTLDPATANFYRHYVDYVFNEDPLLMDSGSAYANATAYAVGDVVRGNGTTGGGRLFVCTTAGTSNTASPTWVTTTAYESTTDVDSGGTECIFTYLGVAPASQYVVGTDYALGDAVQVDNSIFTCTTATVTASSTGSPTWLTTTVDVSTTSVGDSGVFTYRGELSPYLLTVAEGHSPNITILGRQAADGSVSMPAGLESGSVVLLEHEYMSESSRNSITANISNCVDVFVDGSNPRFAESVEIVPDSTHVVQDGNIYIWTYSDPTSDATTNYKRILDGSACEIGNTLQPLYWQPVIQVPDSLIIGENTYYRANYSNAGNYYNDAEFTTLAHYAGYQEVSTLYGTVRARNGIEWFGSGMGANYLDGDVDGGTPLKFDEQIGDQFTISNYVFDQNIPDLQTLCERNKQVTTDVLVHRATPRYFRVNVTVMYDSGANQTISNIGIGKALGEYFRSQYYGAAIQMSDILAVIHSVPGIDNVRWTRDTDGVTDRVEEITKAGVLTGDVFNADFILRDNELPYAPDDETLAAVITRRASHTWNN